MRYKLLQQAWLPLLPAPTGGVELPFLRVFSAELPPERGMLPLQDQPVALPGEQVTREGVAKRQAEQELVAQKLVV